MLDLAGDQRRPPEQPGEQGQEPQQDPHRAPVPEAAGEPLGQVLAASGLIAGLIGVLPYLDELDAGRRGQAVVEAGVGERGAHLQAGGHQVHRQHCQPRQREQCLLAVLAPDQPGHWCTSRLLSCADGPGSAPAEGSAR